MTNRWKGRMILAEGKEGRKGGMKRRISTKSGRGRWNKGRKGWSEKSEGRKRSEEECDGYGQKGGNGRGN